MAAFDPPWRFASLSPKRNSGEWRCHPTLGAAKNGAGRHGRVFWWFDGEWLEATFLGWSRPEDVPRHD